MSEWEKGGVKIRGIVTNEVTKFQGSAQCSVDGGGARAIGFQRSSCHHGHAQRTLAPRIGRGWERVFSDVLSSLLLLLTNMKIRAGVCLCWV